MPPWEYSHPTNLISSSILLLIGSLVRRDAGPSNCGITELPWALVSGDLMGEPLNDLGSYPNVDKLI